MRMFHRFKGMLFCSLLCGIVLSLASGEAAKKKIEVFGSSKVEQTAKEYNIKNIAKLPINPIFASLADKGEIENVNAEQLDYVVDAIISL